MSVDLPHLHSILKDKTRARILELLDQRGHLSYVELQSILQIPHTGKLNYHLKVLGDLITKGEETGQYSLSEKGKIAVALLGKFQTMTESSATLLKAKLKLGIALGVTAIMAALSTFFLLVGIPGSAGTVSLSCSTGNSCTGASHFATTFTPTMYAVIPLLLSIVAGIGFYKRRAVLIWVATALLFIFAMFSLFSIGILYFPFGISLVILIFANKKASTVVMSGQGRASV